MAKIDEIISKSLEQIDSILEDTNEQDVKKAMNDRDPMPSEVSDEVDDKEDDREDEDQQHEEPDGDEYDRENEEEDEPVEKSLVEELESKDNVRKALEVSEFLSELVNGISTLIDAQRADLGKSMEASNQYSDTLNKSLNIMMKSQRAILETQGELAKSLGKLNKRISNLESQPTGRKAALSVVEKSFKDSIGAGESKNEPKTLTKSQAMTILTDGLYGNKGVTAQDIVSYESLGDPRYLSPSAQALLKG